MSARTWAHLHLPRLTAWREGRGGPDVISVKTEGDRLDYRDEVFLSDVDFVVHEGGRQRCLREGVRNVHAWVRGIQLMILPAEAQGWHKAIYDPRKGGAFVDSETLQPVHTARLAWLTGHEVFYLPS